MAIRDYQSFDEYHKECEEKPGRRGLSPGGAAASLGIGRQAVYNACRRGSMDLCRIFEKGEGPYLIVTQESVDRYRAYSLGKVGGPRVRRSVGQAVQERFIMAKDKIVHERWPDD